MLKIEKFIKENKNWEEKLTENPYNLIINKDGDYIILKYNQIESDMNNPICKECRGIIFKMPEVKPVCIPFFKFFNYGEEKADKINWNTARVQEKIDGSIMKVWYDEKWHISTNGVIFADKATNSMDKTFYSMFMEGLKNAINNPTGSGVLDFFKTLNKKYTYMFEMVHPLNRIVVRYNIPMIFHIGTRNNDTYEELDIDIGIPKPNEYFFNKFEVFYMAEKLSYDKEGYVVVDNNWNRVKVKSPAYLAVHLLKNNGVITYKRIITLLMQGENEEFLTYFPEFKPYFDKAQEKYDDYINIMTEAIDEIKVKNFQNRKDYALTVKKYPCPDFFFKVLDKKYTWDQLPVYIKNMGAEKLAKLLKLKDEIVDDKKSKEIL